MEKLYSELLALCTPGDFLKFFYKDFTTPLGTNVRIFAYNYASYEDWVRPGALECRGIMFEMDGDKPVQILSRPMEKFFNLNETPFTMGLDLSTISHFMAKEDGSLISTFLDKGTLGTKSKGSIFSSQAIESKQVFLDYKYADLHARCLELAVDGFTCNFEYVSPTNRIVVAYPEKALVLLNIRNNLTGEYVDWQTIQKDPVLRKYYVGTWVIDEGQDPNLLIEEIRKLTTIEGYVFRMESGLHFKLKTEWYSNLHRVKDTLSNNEALFGTVVAAGSDDLKSLFDDPWSQTKIEVFETIFFDYLRRSIDVLNSYHASNRGASQKDYAVNGQTHFAAIGRPELFGISMMLFNGRLDQEQMVKEINKVFLKNCKKFIPQEYIVATKDSE
ncbi:RNA ligase and tail fiber protein attachment catalyst [Acinetobacter phage Acj9]|uniref:RNA ligase 1 n=1 Tax=Acinetobacter phage Acj9 TaxID=760939 RepID=E5EQ08_9CAUD|nr:RNA ligase and tail fiber protein attachment catalyst [Acinetobacter phage Acj9]ADG60124.1 RnlA RNA ligase 1 and tail fiber attachment catalyst [Acinetobacter phage Acj9]